MPTGGSPDALGAMVWGPEATSFRQAKQMWDEAANGDGEGGVRARAIQVWRPSTRQRYRSAISQLAAVEARESQDLGLAEVLVVCLSEKSDEGPSASGMRGVFSAVRALEDLCIVPPLLCAIHRRIAAGGSKPGAQDYATPEMLRHLWRRATSERDCALVALIIVSWLCFWRVRDSASVRPFDLPERGGVSFHRTKSGGPRGWHRRPLFKYGMSWATYLSEYCERHNPPTDRPIFDGGEAALEDSLTTLLQGSRWSGFAWHSLRRGGAASCWNQKLGLPYLKWGGGRASTGVAMRYVTAFLDHGVLESLALP